MIGSFRSLTAFMSILLLANCTPIGLVTAPGVVDQPAEQLPDSLAAAYRVSAGEKGDLYVSFTRSESGEIWAELFMKSDRGHELLPLPVHFRRLGDGWHALSFDFSSDGTASQHHIAARLAEEPLIAIDPQDIDKETIGELAKKHGVDASGAKLRGKVSEQAVLALLDDLRREVRLKDVKPVVPLPAIPPRVHAEGFAAFGERIAKAPADDMVSDPAALADLTAYLRQAADQDVPSAVYNLARFHANGWGVEQDYGRAHQLAERAVHLGQSRAKNLLGLLAYNGWSVEQDHGRAVTLFREAAAAGEPRAMQMLSWLYFNGEAVHKDESEGLAWLQRAVDAGLPDAAYQLGLRYLDGDGIAKNAPQALALFEKAGSHRDAQVYLGSMHARGLGTEVDQERASSLYLQAAKDGQVWAQWQIGERLIAGQGVEQDRKAGLDWLRRAAAGGHDAAKDAVAKYESAAAAPTESAAPPPPPMRSVDLPDRFRSLYTAFSDQKSVNFTDENMVFAAGMAAFFMEKCDLPRKFADRAEMAKFVAAGSTLAAMGNEYSNPDLGKAWSDPLSGALVYGIGSKAAEQVGCDTPLAGRLTDGLVKAIRANASGDGGGASVFVTSCARTHSEGSCACLADIGRAVVPNIHRMTYHRDIIAQIIKGNPLVALQIPMMCGIVNY